MKRKEERAERSVGKQNESKSDVSMTESIFLSVPLKPSDRTVAFTFPKQSMTGTATENKRERKARKCPLSMVDLTAHSKQLD